MTTPTLPRFAATSRARYQARQKRTKQIATILHKQRNADILLFLWSCGLIALLVHIALS